MTMIGTALPAVDGDDCTWCGEKPWVWSCATCDHRVIKRVCLDCATRWHSRGASKQHALVDRNGERKPFVVWLESTTTAQAGIETGPEPPLRQQTIAEGAQAVTVATEMAANASTPTSPTVTSPAQEEHSDTAGSGESGIVGETEEFDFGVPDEGDSTTEEATTDMPVQGTDDDTQLDLEDVLNRLPSEENAIINALADHIHTAIRVEDAVMCEKYAQCKAKQCQQAVQHYHHVKERKLCSVSMCESIASYIAHMEFCKTEDCAFCVRIQQRRLFGKKHGLNFLIQKQRQAVSTLKAGVAAARFANEQIASLERKFAAASEQVEKLNRLAVTNRLPTFNFPRFVWHIRHEPVVKMEPGVAEEKEEGEVDEEAEEKEDGEVSAENDDDADEDEETETHPVHSATEDDEMAEDDGDAVDVITALIAKKDGGDSAAKAQLETSIQLAFRIVDASFCSHAKASRCLLNCQTILVHLQHHVDLRVCKNSLCDTIEQHFSHVSTCQNAENERNCEYCLRVTEREFARAVEVMEAERVETELKLQRLITSITDSLANDPHDEREDNVMQLEDELQQAEDYKKALLAKMDSASLNLVKARRRMKRHSANPPSSVTTGMPQHFIKGQVPPSVHSKRPKVNSS